MIYASYLLTILAFALTFLLPISAKHAPALVLRGANLPVATESAVEAATHNASAPLLRYPNWSQFPELHDNWYAINRPPSYGEPGVVDASSYSPGWAILYPWQGDASSEFCWAIVAPCWRYPDNRNQRWRVDYNSDNNHYEFVLSMDHNKALGVNYNGDTVVEDRTESSRTWWDLACGSGRCIFSTESQGGRLYLSHLDGHLQTFSEGYIYWGDDNVYHPGVEFRLDQVTEEPWDCDNSVYPICQCLGC